MHGFFQFDDDEERGVIAVSSALNHDSLIDCLCEEWAHARTAYLCDGEEDPHTPSFWAEYGRIVGASREKTW